MFASMAGSGSWVGDCCCSCRGGESGLGGSSGGIATNPFLFGARGGGVVGRRTVSGVPITFKGDDSPETAPCEVDV